MGIWVYYAYGSATSSARDAKQGCRLCTHAFKFMHGRKRTWMTKRKSRGPETDRYQHTCTFCKQKDSRVVSMLTLGVKGKKKKKKGFSLPTIDMHYACMP